jgi:beta-glucosidase
MVLLQNNDATLPLSAETLKSIAVLGPNAATANIMGGGSAHVTPTRVSHPLDALVNRLQPLGIDVQHSAGCNINKKLPELDIRNLRDVRMDYFNDVAQMDNPNAVPDMAGTTGVFRLLWTGDPLGRREPNISFGARMSTFFTPHVSGEWSFSLESVAASRIIIDGVIVLDNADVPAGGSFFGMGKPETIIKIALEAEREYSFVVEVRHTPIGSALSGLTIGAMGPIDHDQLGEAIDLAAKCDVSIVVVGTNDDWESEGWDRDDIDLPGKQDILIHEVAKVSKRTIVVINAGSPVAMPWLNEVDAVVYTWFAGQEMGDALVDLLMGDVEPSGRLPVTMPRRMEDTPAAEHHPGRNGAAKYLEGRLIGYRWYDTIGREPQFPFGFGLGYANVEITDAATSGTHMVNTTLTNSSSRDGVQVVQVYAHLVNRDGLDNDEPFQRLVGWTRVVVPAGTSVNAVVKLDRDAYRTWDVEAGAWTQWSGDVELRVGTSSRHMKHFLPITL